MKQFVVIGLGRFGSSVAKTLAEKGYQVIGIDNDKEVIEGIADFITQAIEVDATDEKAIKSLGMNDIDVAVVGIGDDLEASTLITLILKELGVKTIVAKAVTENHRKVLQRVGATRIVFPERDMGVRIAALISAPEVIDHIGGLSADHSIVEISAPESFVGHSLQELDIRTNYNVNVVAIRKKIPLVKKNGDVTFEDTLVVVPNPQEIIRKEDILIIIGENKSIKKMTSNK